MNKNIWLAAEPLVLASRSEARLAMLRDAGIPVISIPSGIDERFEQDALGKAAPRKIATHLAELKARDVASRTSGRVVLGSDQTLEMDGTTHAKVAGLAEAKSRLSRMAGRSHELHSAYTLICDGTIVGSGLRTARITIRPFSVSFLDRYIEACGGPVLNSVGCYQVEGLGSHLIESIEGDWFTVLGLPLWDVMVDLRKSQHLLS